MNCNVEDNFDTASTLDQLLYVCPTVGKLNLAQKQSGGTFTTVLEVQSTNSLPSNFLPSISPDGTVASVSVPTVLLRLITQPGQTDDNILVCSLGT